MHNTFVQHSIGSSPTWRLGTWPHAFSSFHWWKFCKPIMMAGTDMIRACMQGPALSLEEIDEIPANMAGIWAYIMWEHAGCPNRSSEEADREYQQGISELQQCLCRGKTLDELWKVCSAAHFAHRSRSS
jgi:hypothetical protein